MESEKLVDLISLVASSFTSVDIDILLESVKLENSERLGDDWVLTHNGLTYSKELFATMLNERADKDRVRKKGHFDFLTFPGTRLIFFSLKLQQKFSLFT